MPFSHLRRTLTALALVIPVGAAHPADLATTSAASPASAPAPAPFELSFEDLRELPAAPLPGAGGAVDLAAIRPATGPAQAVAPGNAPGRTLGGGMASYYARQFDGRRTASGERFDNAAMTAAHRTLPFGTRLLVTNPANGRSVVVRVNDRGPFHASRVLDVSEAAARTLGLIARGSGQVTIIRLED